MSKRLEREESTEVGMQSLIYAIRRLLTLRNLFWLVASAVCILSQPEYPHHRLYQYAALVWFSPSRPGLWALLMAIGVWNHRLYPEAIDPRAMVLLVTSVVGLAVGWRNLTSRRGRAFAIGRLITVVVVCFYTDYYASAEAMLLAGVWCIIYGNYFLGAEANPTTTVTDSGRALPPT